MSKQRSSVRRRRECLECGFRFTTIEEIVPAEIYVIKRDQSREDFNPHKLREGITKACWKRPVGESQVESLISNIQQSIENMNEREISSERIGTLVMDRLKRIDDIAYVRFASVYRKFKDIDEFISAIRTLKEPE